MAGVGADGLTATISLRRSDVRELNAQARALMRGAGLLGPDVRLPCGTFAIGDRVVVRRNDRRLGVANGEAGLVEAADGRSGVTVRIGERRVRLPLWYLESAATRPTVQHAYAITGHVAQGMTVERAFVLGSPEMYREWGYTSMSRGRQENRLYVVAPDDLERQELAPADRNLPTARDSLVHGISTSRAQTVALDTGLSQEVHIASSEALRRRLRQLERPAGAPELIAATAARADAAHEFHRMQRELQALQHRQTRIVRSQPSILRPREPARHRAEVARNGDDCRSLRELVTRQDVVVQALEHHVTACEAERAARDPLRRIELELVEEELRRRASMERYLSTHVLRNVELEGRVH